MGLQNNIYPPTKFTIGQMSPAVYEPVNTSIGLNQISREVLDFWEREGTVKRVLSDSSRPRVFSFLEGGPPTANGRPHVGHAMTRTIKDIVLRYKYMQGYSISRRYAGWDCHGLPVELEAEKHFGFKVKKEIEDFGIEKFNSYCRESIFRYVDEWEQVDRLLGFWIDHSKAYVTLRNEYIESEWWALKNLYSRGGLLVKDFKIVPYCPQVRDFAELARGIAGGVRGGQGPPLSICEVSGQGPGGHLLPCLDDHSMDASLERVPGGQPPRLRLLLNIGW